MTIIITGLIIGCVCGYFFAKKICESDGIWEPVFWFGLIGAIVGVALTLIVLTIVSKEEVRTEYVRAPLVALTGSPGSISGSFSGSFLAASGYLNQNPTYIYRYQCEDGATKLGTVAAEGVPIYEENIEPFVAIFEKKIIVNPSWEKFIIIPSWFPLPSKFNARHEYEFHIPKGAVINDINLSLDDFKK